MSRTLEHLPQTALNGTLIERKCRDACIKLMRELRYGHLEIWESGHCHHFGDPMDTSLKARVDIRDPSAWADVALQGAMGAAEAYMDGSLEVEDLASLTRLFVRNVQVLDKLDGGVTRALTPLRRFAHWLNRNTKENSRKNILAHYDLGNDLFERFLDPKMMYSSGVYPRHDAPLETAATHKLDVICQKLGLQPGMHLVEIGTGWGGLAIHAAQNYGVKVTTTTISDAQHDFAAQRIAKAGLEDQITLLKKDYRDLDGQYDRLVSVEMIEAVGHQYLDTFFSKCRSLIKPEGLMLIQAITIVDHRYKQALKSMDFIQKYIFPGGFIPSVSAMMKSVAEATDMRLVQLEDYAEHYARTLAHWRERFDNQIDEISRLGYDERFQRMWRYYLAYCEGGFAERQLGLSHLLLAAPKSPAQTTYSPL